MKKSNYILTLIITSTLCFACNQPAKTQQTLTKPNNKATIIADDEKLFRATFKAFKIHITKKNTAGLANAMNFPFYTARTEENNSLADAINSKEFKQYQSAIYTTDVLRLIPKTKEENLSEIDEKTDDAYYQSLKKITDKNSKLYEVYFQYPETNTHAESYFGFVFGKVKGKFKALAYYGKWPVK